MSVRGGRVRERERERGRARGREGGRCVFVEQDRQKKMYAILKRNARHFSLSVNVRYFYFYFPPESARVVLENTWHFIIIAQRCTQCWRQILNPEPLTLNPKPYTLTGPQKVVRNAGERNASL